MTDLELLRLAAKAAGFGGAWQQYGYSQEGWLDSDGNVWNPFADDGDAFRLAVKLRMRVEPWGAGAGAVVSIDNRALVAEPHYGDDPERATRRAIVRAAAAIGAAKADTGASDER